MALRRSDMADGYFGFQGAGAASGDFNTLTFLIRQALSRINVMAPVKVMGCTNSGGVSPIGTVDVQVQVDLIDGNNVRIPHGTIFKCPYLRVQGGTNAVIIDPVAGDLGVVGFCDRDISSFLANKGASAPGSARRFDMADAVYLYSLPLALVPTQYVQFSTAGIKIVSPTKIDLEAPEIDLVAPIIHMTATTGITMTTPTVTVNGNIQNNGSTTSTGTVTTPLAVVTTTLTVAGKDIGPNHIHDHGTMTASGHTGTVV